MIMSYTDDTLKAETLDCLQIEYTYIYIYI